MIYIGICDDEEYHRNKAKSCCELFFSKNKIDHEYVFFNSTNDVLGYSAHTLSVILLDIETHTSLTGIDIMHIISHNSFINSIIFISNYTDYVFDSFSPKTIGFCPKPIVCERLFPMLETAIISYNKAPIIFSNSPESKIYEIDIMHISAEGHYINVTTVSSESHLFTMGIKSAQNLLAGTNIIRIHRSFLVNLAYIKCVDNNYVTLTYNINGVNRLPIGRTYRAAVKEAYSSYLLMK